MNSSTHSQTIIRPRRLKTVPSSRSGSNDYIELIIWHDGIQFMKCLNLNIYRSPNSINDVERRAYETIMKGEKPIDWTAIRIKAPWFKDIKKLRDGQCIAVSSQ